MRDYTKTLVHTIFKKHGHFNKAKLDSYLSRYMLVPALREDGRWQADFAHAAEASTHMFMPFNSDDINEKVSVIATKKPCF